MIFKGIQKESLIEWPGKICAVVFVAGCNFRCPFCHNRDLVLRPEELPDIDERKILNYLKENRNLLEGLVITGGEPLIRIKNQESPKQSKLATGQVRIKNELIDFIKRVKEIGLLVGVETNGSNPEAIECLIKNKLVDYLAMDIKAPLREAKYNEAAGVRVCLDKIRKSINLIINSKFDYEFRTTVVPGLLSENDILEIAEEIKGAKRFVLGQFEPRNTLVKKFEKIRPYPKGWFKEPIQELKKHLTNVELRI